MLPCPQTWRKHETLNRDSAGDQTHRVPVSRSRMPSAPCLLTTMTVQSSLCCGLKLLKAVSQREHVGVLHIKPFGFYVCAENLVFLTPSLVSSGMIAIYLFIFLFLKRLTV